uniref:Uncharacterized protein n=1 Tax=Rhizophora mucronata TaxID=61149 RepID=A0A2P2PWT8_RHIMU
MTTGITKLMNPLRRLDKLPRKGEDKAARRFFKP